MSIWGKILGGAAGFVLGGPLGALVGTGFGHAMVDRGVASKMFKASEDATKKITFTIGVIALSAKMAKADGQVTEDEVAAFKQIFKIPPGEIKNVSRVFNLARQDTAGYEAYAKQISDLFQDTPHVLEDLIGALFFIAQADGVVHPAEIEFLENVGKIFGFNADTWARIKAQYLGADSEDPYTILGVNPSDDLAAIKKQYRKLLKENHPDVLIAQGLPEEFIQVANEKIAKINQAFSEIKERKKL